MKIGLAICDPGLSFGAILGLAAKERAAALAVELRVASVFSPEEHAEVICRFVADGVDALIVEAVESKVVLPAIEAANRAHIPVVVTDMGIAEADTACSVRSDNVRGGELAAEYLAQRLGGRGTVAHLCGLATSDNGVERTQGFHNVMRNYPEIEVVFERSSAWTTEAGAAEMRAALRQCPSVQAVFANNDPLALGALEAIEEAGMTGRVVVAGFDALPEALLAVQRGPLGATVSQSPSTMGRLALEMAARLARDEAVPPLVTTEVGLVTSANVAEASLATLPLFSRILRDLAASSSALAAERSLLRVLIDNLPDPIYVKDAESRFILANRATLELLGKQREEDVIGRTDFDFSPRELAERYLADEQEILRSGEPLMRHEEPGVGASGKKYLFSTTKVPVLDAAGTPRRIVGLNRDITEQKELEARLLQAQKMEAIGRLAGGIAHDFNNILFVINGLADMLLAGAAGSGGQLSDDLREIRRAGERGAELTSRLLAFSQQEVAGPGTSQLDEVVTILEPLLSRLIGEHIRLDISIPPSLPTVLVDKGQLQQVIVNLVLNARDAMPRGGRLAIEASVVEAGPDAAGGAGTTSGQLALLRVVDTGEGMDAATRERAFEPFFTTKPTGHGTGLGLATVFGVVQRAGGHIALRSQPGEGTTVEVYLPVLTGSSDEPPEVAGEAAVPGGTETVLVVEDEVAVRKAAKRFLEGYGYRVLEAGDGREALEVLRAFGHEVDIVVTDVVMPGMNGHELGRELATAGPALPIVYMSGYVDSDAALTPVSTDAPLLQKPFNAELLATTVREVLAARRP